MYYVYILRLCSGTYYTGSTPNLQKRLREHQAGKNLSTRNLRPVQIVFFCAFPEKLNALRFEKYLKSGSGIAFRTKRLIKSR